ncbi:MAG: alpha-L-rhamnosidase N-terminal domain-containing protein, partial [Chloroflexi bacterium]|nr:alpha-L-rhamnosidase N-terminal domain-containing protein [Chloroflexota bacterium]
MSKPVTPQDFPEIRWKGNWVWVPDEALSPTSMFSFGTGGQKKEAHALFRKTFDLERVPARAPARVTADSRYVLFVNGQEVHRGPIRSQPRRMHYDLFDLAPYLKPGANTLAVYVKYYGTPKSYWIPAVPNMMLGKTGILVFEADLGDAGWLVSDQTWKAHKSDAWSEDAVTGAPNPIGGGIPIEVFDARRFPFGWQRPGFDDSAWDAAQVIASVHIGGFAHTKPPTDPY